MNSQRYDIMQSFDILISDTMQSFEILIFNTMQILVEKYYSKPHSPTIPCNHKHRVVAFTTPLYAASVYESAMELYFLLDQLIGPYSRMNKYPDVDFQYVFSPAQPLSVNPTSSKSDFALQKIP